MSEEQTGSLRTSKKLSSIHINSKCFRDSLSEGGGEEDGYRYGGRDEDVLREDLISLDVKSETETIRAESPDSSRGDSASKWFIYVLAKNIFKLGYIKC